MSILQKSRTRIHVRGLGDLWLLRREPTLDTAFYSAGYLKATTINDVREQETLTPETGHVIDMLTKSIDVTFETALMQTSIDEINLLKDADGKVYAMRYFGLANSTRFQYFCAEQAKIQPGYVLPFAPGERTLPLKIKAMGQDLTYDTPEYYVIETDGLMLISGLELWLSPRMGHNAATAKLLDLSGWRRHGDVSSDFTAIWQANTSPTVPDRFLRFDGTNDSVSFGDVLDDDGTGDFVVEAWLKFPSGGAKEEVISKKALVAGNSAGWSLHKATDDTMIFTIGDGDSNVDVASVATVLTAWKHVAVTVDRNGNAQMYINGVASGSAESVAGQTTGTNSDNLYLGRDGTAFGQVDIGDVRVYRYAAAGLPSTIAADMLAHYNAEHERYGL